MDWELAALVALRQWIRRSLARQGLSPHRGAGQEMKRVLFVCTGNSARSQMALSMRFLTSTLKK